MKIPHPTCIKTRCEILVIKPQVVSKRYTIPKNPTLHNITKHVHSKLCSITHVATKVHVILWSFVVLTWMRDTIELV